MKKSSVKAKGGQNKTNSLGDLISLLRRLKVFRPFFTTSTKNTLTGRRSNYIKSQTAFRVLGTVAISSLVLLFATVIAPIYNTTNSAEATTGTATESTLTFTSTNATASVNLAVNDTAGTFATSTEAQKAAFSITTDNYTGYTLTIKSSSCTTSANCKLGDTFPSITSRTTSADFAVNTWGYIPSYYNSAANTANYYPAPTTSAATLRITSGPNTTEDEYTIGLGIKADFTNPSGTYANETFVLEYVANPTVYSIAYDKGKATSDPSNMPSTQSGSVSAASVTLSSTTPTLTGYTFTGWCLGEVTRSSAEVDSCTGTGAKTFAAGGTFGIDRTSTNSVTLHAMWTRASVNVTVNFAGSGVTGVTFANTTYGNVTVSTSGSTAALKYGVQYDITGSYSSGYEFSSWAATAGSLGSTTNASTTYSTTTTATLTLTGKSSIISLGYMQDLTLDACKVATTSGYVATDKRDGKVYSVRYINDYCWMTQNLRYLGDTGSATGTMTIGNNNSNTDNTSTPITLYSLNSSNAGNFGAYSGHCDSTNGYNYACVYDSGSTDTGVWYNYYAATAGTISTDSNDITATRKNICPKNWHLPTGPNTTANTDINKLVGNTTSNWQSATTGLTAFGAVAGGFYNNGSFRNTYYGFWWSATASSTTKRYFLRYNSNNGLFRGDYSDSRFLGAYVRCVMTPPSPLYDTVASMSKGNFDMSTINTSLTTENSGVYKYTGSHSDNGTSDIYFYRGIIDSSFTDSSAGSSGDGTLYPNYVKLTTTVGGTTYNTCWRIFRTTASGGVKMIYNGLWTGSTCANATTSAQLSSTAYYNRGTPSSSTNYYGTRGFIAYAGYNYNNTYAYNNTSYTFAIDNNTLFTNSTASNIRTAVENWYTSTLGTATNSLLESSAGYCNDRSTYDTSNTETTDTIPYDRSTVTRFGAYVRDVNASPSLACPYPSRDLLTTSNGLGYPVALITFDEEELAGYNSGYLFSGSSFWSLTPYYRLLGGYVGVIHMSADDGAGYTFGSIYDVRGVRPVISLKPGTTPKSGSGTAIDPWVVTPPTM